MRILLFHLVSIAFSAQASAQDSYPVDEGQVLFDGYDPVSYFQGTPTKGIEAYQEVVGGRKILFSTAEHLERYRDNPDRYTPAYGGWCAIAMVDKTFVVPDYGLYKIQDGKLMFFAIRAFFNGLTEWEKDAGKNKIKADTNYVMLFVGH